MTAARRIALMGGSFNPVHAGHLMVARQLLGIDGIDGIDEVWLSLSPLNPLKAGSDAMPMVDDAHRLAMLRIACDNADMPGLVACDVELSMPRPSYTIDTLRRLGELYPDCRFIPAVGSDNWMVFDRWRAHDEILADYGLIIYPRPGYDVDPATLPRQATLVDAPVLDISSTALRQAIAEGRDPGSYLPAGVYEYIRQHKLYSQHKPYSQHKLHS